MALPHLVFETLTTLSFFDLHDVLATSGVQ